MTINLEFAKVNEISYDQMQSLMNKGDVQLKCSMSQITKRMTS
jgi:hypothetical protein